jgi:hypothetical protein
MQESYTQCLVADFRRLGHSGYGVDYVPKTFRPVAVTGGSYDEHPFDYHSGGIAHSLGAHIFETVGSNRCCNVLALRLGLLPCRHDTYQTKVRVVLCSIRFGAGQSKAHALAVCTVVAVRQLDS